MPAVPAVVHAAPLIPQDFNGPRPWPRLAALPAAVGLTVTAALRPVGTIDAAGSAAPSRAARLTVRGTSAAGGWRAAMTSGLLSARTTETNLGKLTLSFDHSVSSARPVVVRIESFDAARRRTGGREGVVYPAAADFYVRSALELSAMRPFGPGQFRPKDPFMRLTFQISGGAGDPTQAELRIDNVCYAAPAFYVSPHGSDANDGRTEATDLADLQKAVARPRPGDIILLMAGTFKRAPTTPGERWHHRLPARRHARRMGRPQELSRTASAALHRRLERHQDRPRLRGREKRRPGPGIHRDSRPPRSRQRAGSEIQQPGRHG